MTRAQFQLLDKDCLAQLTAAAFAALDPTNCIAVLSLGQTSRITANQAALMTRAQFQALSDAFMSLLPDPTFAALRAAECISVLSDRQATRCVIGRSLRVWKKRSW